VDESIPEPVVQLNEQPEQPVPETKVKYFFKFEILFGDGLAVVIIVK
jgi:hypothetical protein